MISKFNCNTFSCWTRVFVKENKKNNELKTALNGCTRKSNFEKYSLFENKYRRLLPICQVWAFSLVPCNPVQPVSII